MCLAIFSPKGTDVPKKEYLQNGFDNNPDGAGYAYNDGGHVCIRKGFMSFAEFWKAFEKDCQRYNFKKRGVLIHFRIGTHGGDGPECTHPFPISNKDKALCDSFVSADFAVVHNGIIYLTADEARKSKKLSDTQLFIKQYLSRIATNPGWFYRSENMKLVEDLIDSKMAILNGAGDIVSTSGFEAGKDGNFYSNRGYLEIARKYPYSSFYPYSFDYEDYYPGSKLTSEEEEEEWEMLKQIAEFKGYDPDQVETWRAKGFSLDDVEFAIYGRSYAEG